MNVSNLCRKGEPLYIFILNLLHNFIVIEWGECSIPEHEFIIFQEKENTPPNETIFRFYNSNHYSFYLFYVQQRRFHIQLSERTAFKNEKAHFLHGCPNISFPETTASTVRTFSRKYDGFSKLLQVVDHLHRQFRLQKYRSNWLHDITNSYYLKESTIWR